MANTMKIKPEHFQRIVQGVEEAKRLYPTFSYLKEVVARDKPHFDAARLYRWELYYVIAATGGHDLLTEIYDYANDTHIETALRRAIPL
jgi:hypothetical protein